MKTYADLEFYHSGYLLGREQSISNEAFPYWAMLASGEIRQRTFERVDSMDKIPEAVQMCCCEIAEKLYSVESVKDENGLIMQSYGNDGETGTYKTEDLSEKQVQKNISQITRKWLSNTDLMYCGV